MKDEEGQPVMYCNVRARLFSAEGMSYNLYSWCDEQGRFRINGLPIDRPIVSITVEKIYYRDAVLENLTFENSPVEVILKKREEDPPRPPEP